MRREVKIGLSVIGGLLMLFSGVLYWRTHRNQEPVLAEIAAGQSAPASSLGHEKPTVLHAQSGDSPLSSSNQPNWLPAGQSDQVSSSTAGSPPRESYMPRGVNAISDGSDGSAYSDSDPSDSNSSSTGDSGQTGRQGKSRDPFSPGSRRELAPDPSTADPALQATEDSPLAAAPETLRGQSDGDERAANPLRRQLADGRPTGAIPTAANVTQVSPHGHQRIYATHPEAQADNPSARDRAPFERGAQWSGRGPERPLSPEPQLPSSRESPVREPQSLPAETETSFVQSAQATTDAVPLENGRYTVQPNDNYWMISQRVFGTGGYFKAIQRHNRDRFPTADKLQVGDVLSIPSKDELARLYPDDCPKERKVPSRGAGLAVSDRGRATGKTYVVEQGDTLFDIARYELGKASRWAEIYELNRDVLGEDFDYLAPGTQLVLPGGSRRENEAITRHPSPGYRR